MRRAVLVLVCAASVAQAGVDADLATVVADLPACGAGRAHCFGLQLHVVVADERPVAAHDWLAAQLAEANRQFAVLDVGFQVVGIDAAPASAAHTATAHDRDVLAPLRRGGGSIDVFIVTQLDDIDQPGEVIRGVTWHVRGDPHKYIVLSTMAPDRVLAHELGHVFDLPHSSYAISIMNKRKRAQPPIEQRRFADEELAAMRPALARLVRDKLLVEVAR